MNVDKEEIRADKAGSGIGRLTAEAERADNERIIKNYKPRGTHTLGLMFKHNPKKTSEDK